MNSLFNQEPVVYSFDASSLIKASGVLYPMENFLLCGVKLRSSSETIASKCLNLFSMKRCEVQF